MGVKDEDFEKIARNQSRSSLYHLAGDSIVTAVLMAIFAKMIKIQEGRLSGASEKHWKHYHL